METLEILFDKDPAAGLQRGVDPGLIAIRPRGHDARRNGYMNCGPIEIGRDARGVRRSLQAVGQCAARPESDARFDAAGIAQLSDFLLRQAKPQRIVLNP